jgi:hypothetical protein
VSGRSRFLVLIDDSQIRRKFVAILIAAAHRSPVPDSQAFAASLRMTARPLRRRLASALSIALLATSAFDGTQASSAPVDVAAASMAPHGKTPDAPQTWPVQTCDDTTAPGSLRYIAVHAISGDTIDFSQLPMLCGMTDSTITLTAGEIVLHQPEITLLGPPQGSGTVTLSGGGQSRVLRHQVYSPFIGTLRIDGLRIVDGYAQASTLIGGGCIYSDANISLNQSMVDGCTAHSSTGGAYGGGLHAPNGEISMLWSKVSGNTVSVDSSNANALGGGSSSSSLVAKYSEIIGNSAQGTFAQGGGADTSTMTIGYSTIADNAADLWGGAISVHSANLDSTVVNSTFSGNHSYGPGGAIRASVNNLHISNSTIASNSTDYDHSGGIYFKGTAANIESTIIAKNTSTAMASGTDLYIKSGTLSGADNAVMSSNNNTQGVIVLTEDPKVAPLAWIGGRMRTMNLLPGSPAIGIGNNTGNWTSDQRGLGFPRTTGAPAVADIGAVQSSDRIFVSDLDTFLF